MAWQCQPLINSGGYRASLDDDLDPRYATESYQHQIPSSNSRSAASNSNNNNVVFDAASAVESQSFSSQSQSRGFPASSVPAWQQQGQTGANFSQSFGTARSWSLSSICAIAWAFPPFTSVFVLVWETENDLARFHAYQSGICGAALILLLWFLRTLLGLKTIGLLVGMGAFGWFWVNASTAHKSAPSLARNPYLPHIGDIASRWVGEE
ncbi:hypothetical protein BCV70DRAFT_212829 [Testicularia cyperi]|uniref:Uncharacterized protein n=1 Tax=Testicularia cyperi TaxID=1882483 RepID=A0A317XJI3_9BASI|nr:hypothetical protein BCV70DRAFT_212829 [Testicularia cyperi]